MFEGTPSQMWNSLSKLRGLPPSTRVFCGHEYTQSNARFALAIDPDNKALQSRAARVDAAREKGKPTVPSTLSEERATNPFLRADDPAFARARGLDPSDPVKVFAEIRARKDNF
jgi:hydroxyacylglutathione hydrolase